MSQRHPFDPDSRPERPHEFQRRVQDLMDQNQWQGIDYVGCDYPEPAEVIEFPTNETNYIYRRKDGN